MDVCQPCFGAGRYFATAVMVQGHDSLLLVVGKNFEQCLLTYVPVRALQNCFFSQNFGAGLDVLESIRADTASVCGMVELEKESRWRN